MSDDQVTVRSITGVDLTLTIAGPGSRSYAFIADWHIRLLISAAWLLLAHYVLRLGLSPRSPEALVSWLPAAIVYFLYHPIVEVAMRGRTPGKRMAAVRILDRGGGVPSTMALIIRNLFRLIDSLPLLYVLGLSSCFITANRVRIGDMAAGTLLVMDDENSRAALARLETLAGGSQLPLEALELVDQVLERWQTLDPERRTGIAVALLKRLNPAADAGQLDELSEGELHLKLQSLINGESSAADA
jgi:uncharacterized RDD family membrane protein YckC